MGGLLPHQTMKVSKYIISFGGKETEFNCYAHDKFIVYSRKLRDFGYYDLWSFFHLIVLHMLFNVLLHVNFERKKKRRENM